jgi:hypothetical protein
MLLEMQSLSFGKLFLANRVSLMWRRLQTKSYIAECVPIYFPFPLLLISPVFIFFLFYVCTACRFNLVSGSIAGAVSHIVMRWRYNWLFQIMKYNINNPSVKLKLHTPAVDVTKIVQVQTTSPAERLNTSASHFGRLIMRQWPPSHRSITSNAVGSIFLAVSIMKLTTSGVKEVLSSVPMTYVDGMWRQAAYEVVLL